MFPSFNFFPRPWRPPSPHDLRANLWNRFLFYLMTQLGSSSLLGYSKIDRRYPGYRINSSRSFFFVRFFIYFSIIISSKYIFLSKSSFERKEEGKQPSLDLGSYYKTAALYIYIYTRYIWTLRSNNHVNNHPFQKLSTKKKTNPHLATTSIFSAKVRTRGWCRLSNCYRLPRKEDAIVHRCVESKRNTRFVRGGGAPSSPATHRAADHRINNKWHASLNRCLEQLHSRYRRPFPDRIASKRRRIRVSVIDDSIGEREA